MTAVVADEESRTAVFPGTALAALAFSALALSLAGGAAAKPVTVADLLAGSPAEDWRVPDPEDTLYMDLARGRVIIELASRVAPQHVANIRALAQAHYFDGLAIVRVQDNYVVQWDDPDHHRAVPAGVRPAVEFTAAAHAEPRFEPLADRDVYAPQVGFLDGFPAARDPRSHLVWLAHCYGMVGAGRDDPPESDGTEMYAVIGHAPRQLDRNVALVGRVLQGIDLLSSLPRGSGEMGFYVASEPTAPIRSVRIAADVPKAERTPIEVLRTDSATFRAVLEQRRQRHEPWFKFSPDRIDLCNVPLPVRAIPQGLRP
jgi:cyclophilin family peptidyl-prolyl cis-trans isomerase